MKRSKSSSANSFRKEKTTLVPVIDRGDGSKAWFAKKRITVNLSSKSKHDLAEKQLETTLLLFEAAKALAKERGITPEDARALFIGQELGNGVEVAPLNFVDYLDRDQMKKFFNLQRESTELQVDVATLLIQERLAFDVTVLELLPDGSFRYEAPGFDVTSGDLLKFGTSILTVDAVNAETISFQQELALSPGTTGFLVGEDGEYLLGDPEWTKEKALLMLDDIQVKAACDFYESCLPGNSLEEGNSLSPSNTPDSSKPEESLTQTGGETSTPNAAPLEYPPKTIDSPMNDLAIAP